MGKSGDARVGEFYDVIRWFSVLSMIMWEWDLCENNYVRMITCFVIRWYSTTTNEVLTWKQAEVNEENHSAQLEWHILKPK